MSVVWLDFEKKNIGRLRRPVLIVAVSTSLPQYKALYSQARELGKHMLAKMKTEEVATLRSSALSPEVIVGEDGISALPACHVNRLKGRRDVLLLTGDSSPMDDQYQFARVLLQYAKDLGVRELFSIGARWTENPVSPDSEPEPNGFATDEAGVAKLKKCGVRIVAEEPAPFFASMVVGMAKEFGIRGYKISVDHGEPSPHTRSVTKILRILSELIDVEIPLDGLSPAEAARPQTRQTGESTIYH